MGANPIQHVLQMADYKAMRTSVASVRPGTGFGAWLTAGAQPPGVTAKGSTPRYATCRASLTCA